MSSATSFPAPILLSLRSWGSLLRGIEPITDLIEETARQGWHGAAIAEFADLGTLVEAADAAVTTGIKLIGASEIDDHHERSVVVIARDRAGLDQLHQLVSTRRLAESGGSASTQCHAPKSFDLVEVLSQEYQSLTILVRTPELAQRLIDRLGSRARQRIFIEIDRLRDSLAREHRNREAADQLGLQIVASTRVGILQSTSERHLDLLESVRRVSTLEGISRERQKDHDPEISPLLTPIPTPNRWQQLYRDLPEALHNSTRIGKEALKIDFSDRKTIFPHFSVPEGQTPFGMLYQQCHRGLLRRYGNVPRAAVERLARELHVIDTMGFVPYFLVVGDIVSEAHRLGIECAGRGSGAASLVSYLLGITQVDPLAHKLRFERFLHPERKDLPDIDIDLCWQGRNAVIDHVYRRYGADRTAMICTRTSLQVRSALRETARSYGLAPIDVDRISRRLPHRSEQTIPKLLEKDPALASVGLSNTSRQQLLEDAQWLRGRPHHRSIHPGGICICNRPIQKIASVERATKGIVVTQLDMYSIEKTGLIKIDLLGNRCVSEIGTVRDLIEERTGKRPDLEAIPEHCEKTAKLLCRGETLGCFQLESPAMRSLLRQMQASDAHNTIQAVALIRPGPAAGGLKESFCRRVRGLEPPTTAHPALQELLSSQQGLLLYEENVMEAIALVTGRNLAKADQFRRALQGAIRSEDDQKLTKLSDEFIAEGIRNGFGATDARELWLYLQRFGRYSFNKAHSASYGLLAWRSAWLKSHHPAEFFCALFRHHAGMYPFSAFVTEARRLGISVKLPCIHQSSSTFILEKDGSIRMPLTAIRGARQSSIDSVFSSRPFASPEDLMRRTRISRSELEEWILAGALDDFSIPRPRLLWRIRTRHRQETSTADSLENQYQNIPSDLSGVVDEGPLLDQLSPQKIIEEEIRLLGAGISGHPMSFYRDLRRRLGCLPLAEVPKRRATEVQIAGLRIASRHHQTDRGPMGFITLEDEQGTCEVTCFSKIWPQVRRLLLDHSGPLLVEGKVDEQLGAFSVIARRVKALTSKTTTTR